MSGDERRYHEAWERLARRGRQFLAVWLGGPFACLILPGIFRRAEVPGFSLEALAFGWLALGAIFGARWMYWPCPRCGNAFQVRGIVGPSMPFTQSCMNCRLPKGAGPGADGTR
jgi:hypothetical protein